MHFMMALVFELQSFSKGVLLAVGGVIILKEFLNQLNPLVVLLEEK
jgi:hypothetical protein